MMLRVERLMKSYEAGGRTYSVLRDVSFSVAKGEFVGVMGASGSGKSTLLNCISCYVPFEEGRIWLGQVELGKLAAEELAAVRNEKLGFVFQDFMLLDGLTVQENILVPRIIRGEVDREGEKLAERLMELFGCVVFTVYAASLFFRKKSRQLGILMALGASQRLLAPGLFREVALLSGVSSFLGILSGFPFLLGLWSLFRLLIVNTPEMILRIDFQCLWISGIFFLLVLVCACLLALVYLRKTNILDVIQEEHRNEPVRQPGRWCGPMGILLVLAGAVAGYFSGRICMTYFHRMPPAALNLTYAPVFVGLYLIMLHTVVNGWFSRKKHPWKGIIARSMMKFQGRQTVNNLLVITVLIAGGCFAVYYFPMMITSSSMTYESRAYDYSWRSPADQELPDKDEITALAKSYNLEPADWKQSPYLALGINTTTELIEADGRLRKVSYEIGAEAFLLPESGYEANSGQDISVKPGTYYGIDNSEGTSFSVISGPSVFTNMTTRKQLRISSARTVVNDMMAEQNLYVSYAVLNDEDYRFIAQGLEPKWMGTLNCFNVDGTDNYGFACDFFHRLVDAYDDSYMLSPYADRVQAAQIAVMGEAGWEYYGRDPGLDQTVDRSNPDSAAFRMGWTYMPQFRILDETDQMKTYAVFLMTFVFIAIVCLTAAMVIAYTRCQTIALNNAYLFHDLKRLGASPEFLQKELRRQAGPVFRIPVATGIGMMLLLYFMMLYANDGALTRTEIVSYLTCLEISALIAILFYAVFTRTLRTLRKSLDI